MGVGKSLRLCGAGVGARLEGGGEGGGGKGACTVGERGSLHVKRQRPTPASHCLALH